MPWSADAARRWFAEPFQAEHPVPRTIGREAEFPVVAARTGELFELVDTMPVLLERLAADHDVSPIVDEYGDARRVCGVRGGDWACFLEGGRGTVEINAGPASSMFELAEIMEPVIDTLRAVLEEAGAVLLGFGIQPRTLAARSTILPRRRYYALADVLTDEAFSAWSVTASDQAHVAVARGEAATVVNALHAATPFVIALTANSSVAGDAPAGAASAREDRMGRCGVDRHGMTPRMLDRIEDYADHLLGQEVLFLRGADGIPVPYGRATLAQLLAERDDADGPPLLTDQDHYSWANARPRRAYSTVEYRPACQQPQEDAWLPTALTIGIVERAERVLELMLSAEGGWAQLRGARRRAIAGGMRSLAGREDEVRRFLDLVADGLAGRGLGEEVFLRPAYERLATLRGPADAARELHAAGGTVAIVQALAYRSPAAVVAR